MEIQKNLDLSKIEIDKFEKMVESIGADNIKEMSSAGPEYQVCII